MLSTNSDCIPLVYRESPRENQSVEGKEGGSFTIPRFLLSETKVKN